MLTAIYVVKRKKIKFGALNLIFVSVKTKTISVNASVKYIRGVLSIYGISEAPHTPINGMANVIKIVQRLLSEIETELNLVKRDSPSIIIVKEFYLSINFVVSKNSFLLVHKIRKRIKSVLERYFLAFGLSKDFM